MKKKFFIEFPFDETECKNSNLLPLMHTRPDIRKQFRAARCTQE
jgi:hypothetical protein